MPATFIYVGNSGSQDITVLQLQDKGALAAVQTVAIPGPKKPGATTPLAVSPDKTRLYAGLRNEPYSVATFGIDAKKGTLSPVGSGPLADSMPYIATDRAGRYLLAASYGGNKVTVSPIGADGVVGETRQIITTLPSAHCIMPLRSNRFVLHTSLGGDAIYQQTFDATTGTLSPNDPARIHVRAKAGPRHLAFSPDESRVYLMNELDGSIYVFPFDTQTGRLGTELQVISALPKDFTGTPSAADIHVTPDGRFLYASERGSHTLAAFRIAGDGTLTPIANYPTEKQPRSFGIDPDSRYLFVVGQLSDSMTAYAIDPQSGALAPLRRYPMGKVPNWVEVVAFP